MVTKRKKENDLLKEKVMKEVRSGRVKMKPRWYFVAGSLIMGAGLGAAMLVSGFLVHLVMFRLRADEPWGYLRFGHLGLKPFVFTFPWLWLGVAVVGLGLGWELLRRYDFSYKHDGWKLLAGLALGAVILGLGMDTIKTGEMMRRVKPMENLYRGHYKGEEFLVGEVVEIEGEEMVVRMPEGSEVRVIWEGPIKERVEGKFLPGYVVRMVGDWRGEVFVMEGITKGRMPMPMMGHPGVVEGWREGPRLGR